MQCMDGEIAGFQIRLDEPLDDRKYLWLSSTNRNRGTGSRSPVTFMGDPYDRTVRVTEGILKATVAHSLSGYSFLGTPGVNQYKELKKALVTLKQNGLNCENQGYGQQHQKYGPEQLYLLVGFLLSAQGLIGV